MRGWDENGRVFATAWGAAGSRLGGRRGNDVEDINHDLELVEAMAHQTQSV